MGLGQGLPLDAVCDALERAAGPAAAVVRVGEHDPGSANQRWLLARAGRILAVCGGGPVPVALQGREDLHGCDVLLLEGAAGARGFGLWLEVLRARARHVAPAGEPLDVAMGRVARRLTGRSVGLVLSGGGARALAHIGAIEELLAAGIRIDRVGGTSMGAFLGALVAMGMDPEEIEARCYEEWVRRSPLTDYRLPRARCCARAPGPRDARPDAAGASRRCRSTSSASRATSSRASSSCTAAARWPTRSARASASPASCRRSRSTAAGWSTAACSTTCRSTSWRRPARGRSSPSTSRRAPAGGPTTSSSGCARRSCRTLTLGSVDTAEAAQRHADLVITPSDQGAGMLEFHLLDDLRAAGRRAARRALQHAPARLFG